jgi:predicted Zn-dependent peptidase
MMTFQHAVLENGLEIVAETNPHAHSAAIGFFVKTGARDETPDVSGVSHFLEHMAFKGDEHYSAEDVNRVFDEVGASYNASTSEELTFYYAAILPEYLDRTFELLAALMRPSLREEDFEMEKQVILEEIGMYDDLPTFAVYEQAMGLHFRGRPLGQNVLGSRESITALTAAQMRRYHQDRYGARNLVLAAAGGVDWDRLFELAQRHCGGWAPGVPGRATEEVRPEAISAFVTRESLNQEHVMQLAPAPSAQSPLRYAADIAATIVGDDGAGRLYWDLVETGLAESADLSYNDFDGTGIWATYLCCQPEQALENLQRIETVYADFNRQGPTEDEFERARTKVATRVVLAGERPISRLGTLGGNWAARREYRSIADDLQTLQKLTLEDVRELLAQYPLAQTTTAGLGALEEGVGV